MKSFTFITFCKIYLILCLTRYSNTNNPYFDKIVLNTTAALCLDGSPGAYYLSKTGDNKKVVILFQGGAWCYGSTPNQTLQSCYQRVFTTFGTSSQEPAVLPQQYGPVSPYNHNYFKGWRRVFMKYCDGSGHQGTRKDPILYKNTSIYFRGHNITQETFLDLQQKIQFLSQTQKIVVTGASAGALSVFHWTNYLVKKVNKANIYALPISGVFLDIINSQVQQSTIEQLFTSLMSIVNKQIQIPAEQCVKQFSNAKLKCFFAQNLYKYIKVPLFVMQSLYDSYSIESILGISCIQKSVSKYSLNQCTVSEKDTIQEFRTDMTRILTKMGNNNAKNGIWAPACTAHGITLIDFYLNKNYAIPQYSQNLMYKAIQRWMQGTAQNNTYIDLAPWPSNHPCSYIYQSEGYQKSSRYQQNSNNQSLIIGLSASSFLFISLGGLLYWYMKKNRLQNQLNQTKSLVKAQEMQKTEMDQQLQQNQTYQMKSNLTAMDSQKNSSILTQKYQLQIQKNLKINQINQD